MTGDRIAREGTEPKVVTDRGFEVVFERSTPLEVGLLTLDFFVSCNGHDPDDGGGEEDSETDS